MRVATLYDLLAPLYERVVLPLHDVAVARAAQRALGGWPKTVLEVGIGPGRGVAQLGGSARRVVGVDVSRRMLRLANAHLASEHVPALLARGDVLTLPFGGGAFEAVVATFLLDLLRDVDLPVALAELCRVLAPGGRLVLGTLELGNRITERAWMVAYRALPDLVGRCRPITLTAYLERQPLRLLREEEVRGPIGMRLATLVKSG